MANVTKVVPELAAYFDLAAMLSSETGSLDSGVVRNVSIVLLSQAIFCVHAEMFAVVAVVLERFASKLEGCLCHEDLLRQP